MSSVFIIINEWVGTQGIECTEVVGSRYFKSEREAWEALRDIARSFEEDIDYDATSLVLENHVPHLEYEEYYMQELTKEGNR